MPRKLSRRAGSFWLRLSQSWGSKFLDAYGPTPPDDWANAIERADDERLEQALTILRRESPTFPPTLGQLENAIPKRQSGALTSKAQQIAELMLSQHGKDLCVHQIGRPWSYFGPLREFLLPKIDPPEYITVPDPRGVQVAECAQCERPSYRVLLERAVTEGVAA
jgi:hypothetical protein